MKNKEVRKQIQEGQLYYWEVAEAIGISPSSLCIWMRNELEGERLNRVQTAIKTLINDRRG